MIYIYILIGLILHMTVRIVSKPDEDNIPIDSLGFWIEMILVVLLWPIFIIATIYFINNSSK